MNQQVESIAAVEHLVLSRQHLRQALIDLGPSAQTGAWRPPSGSAAASSMPHAALRLPAWLDRLAGLPGASVLVEALRAWWARHPLRLAAQLANDAAQVLVLPLAQTSPVGLVLGAALAGALLAWSRPWRWALKPALTSALLTGLLPQLVSQAVRQAPRGTWTMLLSSLMQPGHARDAGSGPGPGPGPRRQSQ